MRMLGSGLAVRRFGEEAACCDESCDGAEAHPVRRDVERRQMRKADGEFMVLLLRALLFRKRCAGKGDLSVVSKMRCKIALDASFGLGTGKGGLHEPPW